MMSPATAARIWFSQGKVRLELPSTIEDGKAHSLSFDDDLAGRARIFAILREREKAHDLRLSLRGTPTQSQLPEYDPKRVRRARQPMKVPGHIRDTAREVMRKLGMI
jgi:hypothetical protein